MISVERHLRASGATDIVSVSGGKDSTATYLLAIERGRPFVALFADTGNEHPHTYEYVRQLAAKTGGPEVEWVRADFASDIARKRRFIAERWAEDGVSQQRIDRALELLQPTGSPYLDLCMWKGRFPSRKAQFCTEELKRRPLDARILQHQRGGGWAISWIGVRWDESPARSGLARWIRDDGRVWRYHPIRKWSAADVFALHRRHGLEPNPLYMLGMGRVGCMPCINARKGEIAQIARRFPQEVERIAEWERLVAEVSKRGAATYFARDTAPGTPVGAPIRDVALWARLTRRGGRNLDLEALIEDESPPPACQSIYGLCEGAR